MSWSVICSSRSNLSFIAHNVNLFAPFLEGLAISRTTNSGGQVIWSSSNVQKSSAVSSIDFIADLFPTGVFEFVR